MEALEYIHSGYMVAPGGSSSAFNKEQVKASGTGDSHFIVEDLLDFPNDDGLVAVGGGGDDTGSFEVPSGGSSGEPLSILTAMDSSSCNSSSSASESLYFPGDVPGCPGFAAEAGLSGEFCVPYDELAELEWLSNIVDESFSSEDLEKLQLISGVKCSGGAASSETNSDISSVITAVAGNQTVVETSALFPADAPIRGKARSKRSRAAPGSWASRLIVLSPTSSNELPEAEAILPPSPKKAAKQARSKEGHDGAGASEGRKCLHCATDTTPQWRTGPMGPKTLCNACGVRYKSGRLVPEYRPAASPTFVMSKHSNSHRKVMELRRQKDMLNQQHQGQFLHHQHQHQRNTGHEMATGVEFLIHHQLGPDFRQLI